jgi:polyketide synthase 12/epothilone polyketide synthase D
VGLAAIALAKHVGASVYATAGSAKKRQELLDLGCAGAFDSRSTSWYADLMLATQGQGVDLVLNSLAGEHIDLCLEALRAEGWHCEIGKMDIYSDRPLRMSVLRKNLRFAAVDIDRLMMENPKLAISLSEECLRLVAEGHLPALPTTEFGYAQYREALGTMMRGEHRGKIVLRAPRGAESLPVCDERPLFSQDHTVLLSGCMGDFGLRLLAYIVAMGARHVLMFDRDPTRRRTAEWVRNASSLNYLQADLQDQVRIEIVHADVSKWDHVVAGLAKLEELGMPPLRDVFHLAGVLDDKLLGALTEASFRKVYEPKALLIPSALLSPSEFQI